MENNSQLEVNKKAIESAKEVWKQPLRDVNATELISYVRNILGFKCTQCLGTVTYGNLKFCNFSENTKCFSCQTNNT